MSIKVVAITPVYNETAEMIVKFINGMDEVRAELAALGVDFSHFLLNDGALHLPEVMEEVDVLVKHKKNLGLATTLVDGYEAVLALETPPDIIIRLDCQEHDPWKIISIVDSFLRSSARAIFLPVWYWTGGENRPMQKDIMRIMVEFCANLSPINIEVVLSIYNQKFPLGYQAFGADFLREIFPSLKKGLDIFQDKFNKPATWGFDLLAMLLAAKFNPETVDFMFGGWSKPWVENRGPEKITAQQERARCMIDVAKELGCR
jgi:hypothetical protein